MKAVGNYWTEEQDNAIAEFVLETDLRKRDQIFNKKLYAQLVAMSQTILKKYFRKEDDVLVNDAVSHCVTVLSKFNPERAKSYSFCQTVIKNHFHDAIVRKNPPKFDTLDSIMDFESPYLSDYDDEDLKGEVILKLKSVQKEFKKSEIKQEIVRVLINHFTRGEVFTRTYLTLLLLVETPAKSFQTLKKHLYEMGISFSPMQKMHIDSRLKKYADLNNIPFDKHDLKKIEAWQVEGLSLDDIGKKPRAKKITLK